MVDYGVRLYYGTRMAGSTCFSFWISWGLLFRGTSSRGPPYLSCHANTIERHVGSFPNLVFKSLSLFQSNFYQSLSFIHHGEDEKDEIKTCVAEGSIDAPPR